MINSLYRCRCALLFCFPARLLEIGLTAGEGQLSSPSSLSSAFLPGHDSPRCSSAFAANKRGIQCLAVSDIEASGGAQGLSASQFCACKAGGPPLPPPPPPMAPPATGRTRLYKAHVRVSVRVSQLCLMLGRYGLPETGFAVQEPWKHAAPSALGGLGGRRQPVELAK